MNNVAHPIHNEVTHPSYSHKDYPGRWWFVSEVDTETAIFRGEFNPDRDKCAYSVMPKEEPLKVFRWNEMHR